MIPADLVKRLVCPETRRPLALGEASLVDRLNRAIAASRLKNQAGVLLDERLDGALVRADGAVAYPIVDDIPRLLVDEAIPLEQLQN
jgi:uncharacterized protein YbaR (Trm112 family)